MKIELGIFVYFRCIKQFVKTYDKYSFKKYGIRNSMRQWREKVYENKFHEIFYQS